jgi:hypothetical protein
VTALITPTGRGIGIREFDGIGCRDTGLGDIIIASGFTGTTLLVRNWMRFQRLESSCPEIVEDETKQGMYREYRSLEFRVADCLATL